MLLIYVLFLLLTWRKSLPVLKRVSHADASNAKVNLITYNFRRKELFSIPNEIFLYWFHLIPSAFFCFLPFIFRRMMKTLRKLRILAGFLVRQIDSCLFYTWLCSPLTKIHDIYMPIYISILFVPVKVKVGKKVVSQGDVGRSHLWRNRVSDGFILM